MAYSMKDFLDKFFDPAKEFIPQKLNKINLIFNLSKYYLIIK